MKNIDVLCPIVDVESNMKKELSIMSKAGETKKKIADVWGRIGDPMREKEVVDAETMNSDPRNDPDVTAHTTEDYWEFEKSDKLQPWEDTPAEVG